VSIVEGPETSGSIAPKRVSGKLAGMGWFAGWQVAAALVPTAVANCPVRTDAWQNHH